MFIITLFEFGKTTALAFLLNDYFIRNYPEKHNQIVLSLAFKLVYMYSYCQILCKNGITYIENTSFLKKFIKEKREKKSTIEFIKNNELVDFVTTDKLFLYEQSYIISDYDFILYKDNQKNPCNIKIIYKNNILNEEIYKYEISKIKFMLVEFIINEKVYIIELSNDKYNFYLKDNIFNKQFFLYYLSNIHPDRINVDDDDEMDEIIVKIIDHNVDIKTIYLTKNNNQYIKLNEFDYQII